MNETTLENIITRINDRIDEKHQRVKTFKKLGQLESAISVCSESVGLREALIIIRQELAKEAAQKFDSLTQ